MAVLVVCVFNAPDASADRARVVPFPESELGKGSGDHCLCWVLAGVLRGASQAGRGVEPDASQCSSCLQRARARNHDTALPHSQGHSRIAVMSL